MKITNLYFVSILAVLFLITGCTAALEAHKENRFGWRPLNFAPESGTLLIVQEGRWDKKKIEKMKKFMERKYPYKYVFLDHPTAVAELKYKDLTEYRFVLYPTYERRHITLSDGSSDDYDYYAHYFFDRVDSKTYKETLGGSHYVISLKLVIKACLKPIATPKN